MFSVVDAKEAKALKKEREKTEAAEKRRKEKEKAELALRQREEQEANENRGMLLEFIPMPHFGTLSLKILTLLSSFDVRTLNWFYRIS